MIQDIPHVELVKEIRRTQLAACESDRQAHEKLLLEAGRRFADMVEKDEKRAIRDWNRGKQRAGGVRRGRS